MKIPLRKLKAIILYFCENTDSKFLGKVKLMKLFYFLDFTHVKRHGIPVTWDHYVHLEYGPIPSTIKNLVDDAGEDFDSSPLADTIGIEKKDGVNMYRIVQRRKFTKADEGMLSENELDILKEVCQRFGNENTAYIVKQSHEENPWKKTRLLQEIPYALAADDSDSRTSKEIINLSLKLLG
ncbi:MAG: Panacea domain-containing protein [bacterium]|nr:Panacea domain-containing protein [bacterium]